VTGTGRFWLGRALPIVNDLLIIAHSIQEYSPNAEEKYGTLVAATSTIKRLVGGYDAEARCLWCRALRFASAPFQLELISN
jgi:hypothetical protein